MVPVVSGDFQPSSHIRLMIEPVDSHLQTQRSAVKMLHERIMVLVKYVSDVIAGRQLFLCPF